MRFTSAALSLLLCLSGNLFADLVITQKVEGSGQAGEVVIKVKGDKVRSDLPQNVSSITNAATGEVLTLMHGQKSYLRIPAERSREMLQRMQERVHGKPASTSTEPPKLEPTGKKEKIGEWEAEVFTSKVGGIAVTYWIAKDFPNYAALAETLKKIQETNIGGLGPKTDDFGGMPVKTEMNLGGKKITNTIVSVKEEPVDEGIFTPPKNYKEIELPEQK